MDDWRDRQNRAWDRQQSVDIGHHTRDLAVATADISELQRFLGYVVAKLALGQAIEPGDPAVRAFFQVGRDDDPRRALQELVGNVQHRYTPRLVKCRACGAAVRDLPGVTDERCNFCGATVHTQD